MALVSSSTRLRPGHIAGPALNGMSAPSPAASSSSQSAGAKRSAWGKRWSSRWKNGAKISSRVRLLRRGVPRDRRRRHHGGQAARLGPREVVAQPGVEARPHALSSRLEEAPARIGAQSREQVGHLEVVARRVTRLDRVPVGKERAATVDSDPALPGGRPRARRPGRPVAGGRVAGVPRPSGPARAGATAGAARAPVRRARSAPAATRHSR